MPANLDDAYADLNEMFGDLFQEMGLEKPTPEQFRELMAPVLRETQGTRMSADDDRGEERDSRNPDANVVMERSQAANASFYDALKAELRRRIKAKKVKGPPM